MAFLYFCHHGCQPSCNNTNTGAQEWKAICTPTNPRDVFTMQAAILAKVTRLIA